jgi:hypothetical protein
MCRNIKTLYNFDPPVTEQEIHAASLQFIRKISGFQKPSKVNEAAFLKATEDVACVSAQFLAELKTTSTPRNREKEAAVAKTRNAQRFATHRQD